MKILLVNDRYPPQYVSSVATMTKNLAEAYTQRGHTVHILTSHRHDLSEDVIRNDHTISLPIDYPPSRRHYKSLKQSAVSAMIEQEMQTLKPDIVHAHNIHMYLTYDALRIAHKYTDAVHITMHDVMSFHYGRLTTQKYLSSAGSHVHTTAWDHLRVAGLQYNPLRNYAIRKILTHHTRNVIAVSSALQKALDANAIPHTCMIHNGIDVAAWKASNNEIDAFRKKHTLDDRKVILFGGRLSRDKGSTPILKALAQIQHTVPNALLLVIGDAKRWSGLLRESGITEDLSAHIRHIDWLSQQELRAAYGACDCVTTPSLCLDTFNLMNAEAMANAKPVVGTCFGGTPEIVEDGSTGFICNPLKTDTYADALTTLLTDDTLAKTMGEAGRMRIEKNFSLEKQVDAYLELYKMGSTR